MKFVGPVGSVSVAAEVLLADSGGVDRLIEEVTPDTATASGSTGHSFAARDGEAPDD